MSTHNGSLFLLSLCGLVLRTAAQSTSEPSGFTRITDEASLYAAFDEANVGQNVSVFIDISGGTLYLTKEIHIQDKVAVVMSGPGGATLDAGHNSRHFTVDSRDSQGSLSLFSISLVNGWSGDSVGDKAGAIYLEEAVLSMTVRHAAMLPCI